MAYSAKVPLLVSGLLLSWFAFTHARLVTFEGNEANANKQYVEEVVVQSTAVHVTNKDSRKDRNRSQAVSGDGATVTLNRKTRSLPYPNTGYQNNLYNQVDPYLGNQVGGNQFNRPQFPYQQAGYHQPIQPQPISIDTSYSNSDTHRDQTHTPYGNIGSSISDTQSNAFHANQYGLNGGTSIGGNREIKLPFGVTLTVNYADGYSENNNGVSRAGSNSVVLRGPNGLPIYSSAYN